MLTATKLDDIEDMVRRASDIVNGPRLYVNGLDERMSTSVPAGSIVLICGTPGTLKTTLCMNILYNHAVDTGEKVLYLTLEQDASDVVDQMIAFGYDMRLVQERLRVLDLSDVRNELLEEKKRSSADLAPSLLEWASQAIVLDSQGKVDWMRTLMEYQEVLMADGISVLCIDSLDALYSLMQQEDIRDTVFNFFESLRHMGMTVFLISEMKPGSEEFGKYGNEGFLADGIVHLKTERKDRSVGRFISIVKMRKVSHPIDYFPLWVDREGFSVIIR